MRPPSTRIVAVLLVLVTGLLASACSGGPSTTTTVTRARLERSLERSYANRYVALSKLLGHPGVTVASLDAHAVCDKGGPTNADEGPGGDWICQIAYTDANVPNPDGSAKVEMNVHSNDCYTGAGSTKLVGPLNIVDTHGKQVVNPAFEFDACFDPSSDGAPDGTILVVNASPLPGAVQLQSALTLPTGLVHADSDGKLPLEIACAADGPACTGSIDVTLQGAKAGSVHYDIAAGATKPVDVALTSRQVRDGGIVILTPHERTPKPEPVTP